MTDKPASKDELLDSIKQARHSLEQSLKHVSDNDMIKTSAPGEWSVQDIIAHITAWEQKLLNWYEAGLRGEKQTMPEWGKPGVIDDINRGIYRANKDRWLKEVKKEFKESYKQTFKTIKSIPEEWLFTAGKFDWTGKDTLADYVVSNTSRHYIEHIMMIEILKQKLGIVSEYEPIVDPAAGNQDLNPGRNKK
jgi:hypothetical protein